MQPVIFYDGVCGLCDRFCRFVLEHDRRAVFLFAPLQSDAARELLLPYGADPGRLDTVYVLADRGLPSERLLARGKAVMYVLGELDFPWRLLSALRVLPAPLLDAAYRLVAAMRYRLFGRADQCMLPRPEWCERFLG